LPEPFSASWQLRNTSKATRGRSPEEVVILPFPRGVPTQDQGEITIQIHTEKRTARSIQIQQPVRTSIISGVNDSPSHRAALRRWEAHPGIAAVERFPTTTPAKPNTVEKSQRK